VEKTVTRALLSDRAVQATGCSRQDASTLVDRLLEIVGEELSIGETVKLTGFGTLQVRSRAERVGRNPRTGVEHPIAPHQTVVFIPSARLRDALDDLAEPKA
jgi:integration host factor subunit alpha